MEHVGGCNALCNEDRHYLIGEPAPAQEPAALGEGWTDIGFSVED